MDRTCPKQQSESEVTSSTQKDIQGAGLDGRMLNGITLGASPMGGGKLDESTEIRCESSNTLEIESAPELQMRSTAYQARHTPAFNIERKLRRRRKAAKKKKQEQTRKKEERLSKAKIELEEE